MKQLSDMSLQQARAYIKRLRAALAEVEPFASAFHSFGTDTQTRQQRALNALHAALAEVNEDKKQR